MAVSSPPIPDPSKQRRVAQHYLTRSEGDAARLHRTVSLAARAMNFPIGQINIIDDRLLYTIGDYRSGATTLDRDDSLCHFLVDDGVDVLAVDDLLEHERYQTVPAVRGGVARSYLGVPLTSREATVVGTLCVVDDRVRRITTEDVERIKEFAEIVEDQLDLARRNAETPASRVVSTMLAAALDKGEVVPWYQPVVDLETGERTGFEALARWRREDGSVVDPESFVAAAEDSDLVIDLDRSVARAALQDLARWHRIDPTLKVGVNFSTRHLELPDGPKFMVEAAQEAGVDPSRIAVEITESRELLDVSRAATAVWELRTAGFRVFLDDFANGWSGLDWLIGLGANGLKLDRTVTTALGTPVGDAVCRAVVGMAKELHMTTTIEGIGDAAHYAAARAHGFRLGQGYFWSPPVPAATIDASM